MITPIGDLSKEEKRKHYISSTQNNYLTNYPNSLSKPSFALDSSQGKSKILSQKGSGTKFLLFRKMSSKFKRERESCSQTANGPLEIFRTINKKRYGHIIHKILFYDKIIGILSLLSFIIIVIDNEISIQKINKKTHNLTSNSNFCFLPDELITLIKGVGIGYVENLFRYINVIFSVILVICLIIQYKWYFEINIINNKQIMNPFVETKNVSIFIIECVVSLIAYPPHINKIFFNQ